MSDPRGGPGDATRPDHEPTLNEAGLEVFAVDGTDSFAVPGPADGQVVEDSPVPPPVSRTRVFVTAGAVIAGLAFVVAVGAGSAEDPSLRTGAEAVGPGFSTPLWRTDDGDGVDLGAVRLEPYDDETLALLEAGGADDGGDSMFEDEYGYDESDDLTVTMTTFPPTDTIDPFEDDFFDPFDEEDDDFSTYRPSYTVPRRVTTPTRRSVVTVPRRVTTTTTTTAVPTTTTTTAPTTTTTTTTTTTVEATTTSSSTTPTTPTTPLPAPAWQPAAKGLPECPANLQVWARGNGVVAASGGSLYQRTTGDWTPLGGALPGATRISAFVPGVNDSTYVVGTDAGVFAVVGGTVAELGELTDVTSLSVTPNGASLLAVTARAQLNRWNGAAWEPATLPAPGATLETVHFLNDTAAVLGTSAGVFRSADAGQTWGAAPVSPTPVVGRPVQGQNTYYWLLSGGAGLLRSTDLTGLAWTAYAGGGAVAADHAALAVRPGQLLTWGDPAGGAPRLVASTDGGGAWAPVEPTTPYRPDGLVHAGGASYAFTADCNAGVPGGADSVVRLEDPAAP